MDETAEMFYGIGVWVCLRPWLMALIAIGLIVMAFSHFRKSRWHLRSIAGGLILLAGLVWLAAAALEEHCRRWSEANMSSVPIRVDLVLIPAIILPAAVVAIVLWALAFKAKREDGSQPATAPYSEPAKRSPQG
jgi:hypothetical protein